MVYFCLDFLNFYMIRKVIFHFIFAKRCRSLFLTMLNEVVSLVELSRSLSSLMSVDIVHDTNIV